MGDAVLHGVPLCKLVIENSRDGYFRHLPIVQKVRYLSS